MGCCRWDGPDAGPAPEEQGKEEEEGGCAAACYLPLFYRGRPRPAVVVAVCDTSDDAEEDDGQEDGERVKRGGRVVFSSAHGVPTQKTPGLVS